MWITLGITVTIFIIGLVAVCYFIRDEINQERVFDKLKNKL